MDKVKKSSVVVLIFALTLFVFCPTFSSKASAMTATATGPYSWTDPGGITHTTAYIKVGDQIVYCIDPDLPAPYGGHSYNEKRFYDDSVLAILYYGYGGAGNELGSTMKDYVKTYVALNNWKRGKTTKSTYSNQDSEVWKLIQHAKNQDAPITTKVSFSDTNVSTTVSGNVQKSETIKFVADDMNSVTIPLPSDVTIHVGSKTKTGGSYTVKGGESFYFTAPLDYGTVMKTGSLSGKIGTYAGLLYLPSSSNYQQLNGAKLILDPQKVSGFTVNFKAQTSTITVIHKDKYEGTVFRTDKHVLQIGSKYSYSPDSSISYKGKTYVPVDSDKVTGTVGTSDKTITFYYASKQKVTVKHIDNRAGTLIKSESYTMKRGDKYSFTPRTDLKKGKYTYRPISLGTKSGTVGDSDVTITFYYDVPLLEVGLKKLQIYTDNSTKGLPVKLWLKKSLNYDEGLKDFENAKIDVALYQGSTKLQSKTYTAKSLPESLDMKVPSNGLNVNEHKPYTVKFEAFNKNDIDVPTATNQLTTQGYTSSEETINLNVNQTLNGYNVSHIVMTEITPTTPMKSYYETFTFTGTAMSPQKTGYGTQQHINYIYKNDIDVDDKDSTFTFHVPSKLMDSFLNYTIQKNEALIPMDKTNDDVDFNDKGLLRETLFEFPHVNVERETGYLFTDSQVKNKDSHITKSLIDGGRKFYSPIWADLGNYDVSYQSNKLGVNDIQVIIKDTLELDAFMLGHMDSTTKEKDVIMLVPINADDPFPKGVPNGWTSQDIAWLKK